MKMKRVLSFLLAAALIIGMLPAVTLLHASAATAGDTYDVSYGTLNSSKSVSLPITIHNYPNDGMLFEYSSYVGKEQYIYARAHAEVATPGYGQAWYANGYNRTTKNSENFTVLGTYYLAAWNSVKANAARNPDGTSPYYYAVAVSTEYNADVKLYSEDNTSIPEAQRRWLVLMDSEGYYLFYNFANGSCLDLYNSDAHGNVWCWTPNYGAAQRWKPIVDADGGYHFVSKAQSTNSLDLDGGNLADGTNVHVWDSDYSNAKAGEAQKWALIPVSGESSAKSGVAGQAMRVVSSSLSSAQDSYYGGGDATVLEQTTEKENARYLSIVYQIDGINNGIATLTEPFKIVPVNNTDKALDVSNGHAADGTKIQIWSSGANDDNTTKYLMAEPSGDGSYYLRWYRRDSGTMTATDFYVGGVTDIGVQAACKTKSSANRFQIVDNGDGSYSFRVVGVKNSTSGEQLYLDYKGSSTDNGTAVQGYTWSNTNGHRFYLQNVANEKITFAAQTYTLYPGFDDQPTEESEALKANGIRMELSTAPGYHRITLDLSTAAGYAAAQKLTSLTVGTPSGKRVVLDIAAIGGFETEQKATNFGYDVTCGMLDCLSYGSYSATKQWRSSTEADYNASDKSGSTVRRYRTGNNLAYGMLLPNSGYNTVNSYYQFDNFGYASPFGTDTTVQDNLASNVWKAYAIYQAYTVPTSAPWGRWYVQTQGDSSYNTVSSSTSNFPVVTLDGVEYSDISKYLPNMHSYIDGMATIGLVNYTLDPETKNPVYTQETVQKLAKLLQASLGISEVYEASSATYNYNFVQGEKVFGTKDWAQSIRDYLATCPNPGLTELPSGDSWDSYKAGHDDMLDLSWEQVTNGDYQANFNNYLDIAYWMLHTLYKDNNGVSTVVPEYDHLTLTQETNSSGKTYYVFDGGYDDLEYNTATGAISHTSSTGTKGMVYYTSTSATTAKPFLPTTDSVTYNQTNSPYFADDGVSNAEADRYDTYVGRDYNFSMEGHGQFVFNTEDNLYFNFQGDDDVYLFINNKLVMDIGAAHSITNSMFNLNDYVKECGLVDGETYEFDFYYMERHGYGSNIRIETNIEVTSKDVVSEKGAIQDGQTLNNYGLADQSKVLEYYFTLRNDDYALPLTNLAFEDEKLGFSAGYNGVTLGSYKLNGTSKNRAISDLHAVLTLADGTEITLRFADTQALQDFLTDVKCDGHPSAGLSAGESLTIYGVRYGLLSDGIFKNTVYTEAGSIRGKADFAVFAGVAQHYYMWAGHPIAVSVGDAAGTVLGSEQVGALSAFTPASGNGATTAYQPLADGVYTIGATKGRTYTWAPGSGDQLVVKSAKTLYEDGTSGNEPLFYVRYAGGGYYTIQYLQDNRYACIDITSGTNASSRNDTADYDDRIVLRSFASADAAAADKAALWQIGWNADHAISSGSDANSFIIRPALGSGYAVDLDGGKLADNTVIHLWTNSSGNVGWQFNSVANGYTDNNTVANDILVFDYSAAGTYSQYYLASYTDGGATVSTVVPVVIHVLDVKDNTYVLDYGLPVNLNNAADGGLLNNDTTQVAGTTTTSFLEGMITGEGYEGLARLAREGKITDKTNAISGTAINAVRNGYGSFTAMNGDAAERATYRISYTANSAYVLSISDAGSGNWEDTKPSGVSDENIESRTVYRYSDRITTPVTTTTSGSVQYVESFPSGFDTGNALYAQYHKSPVSGAGITTNSTTTVGYIYWHWCRNVALGSPWIRTIGSSSGSIDGVAATTFHAWFNSNYATAISGGADISRSYLDSSLNPVVFRDPGDTDADYGPFASSYSKQYCQDSALWYTITVKQQNYTKTSTSYTYTWSDYTDWSPIAVVASDTRKVETKTQYRAKTDTTIAEGTALVLQERDDSNLSQLWYFNEQDDGSYVIENVKSGMTLQLAAQAANGVAVVQKTKNATPDGLEKWNIVKNSSGNVELLPASNNSFAVDLPSGNTVNNTAVTLYTRIGNGHTPQTWTAAQSNVATGYDKLVFTPEQIMNGASQTKVVVRTHAAGQTPSDGVGNVDVHKEVEMYENVITIPASVVYYEDNFGGIDYAENSDSWIDMGQGDGNYQDADQNEQYGHDGSYENEGYETSGGSVTKITVTEDTKVLSFQFHGTGFEIISRCSANCSATVVVTVYDSNGTEVRNIPAITEYDNNGDDEGDEVVYQAPIVSVNDLDPADYSVQLAVTARQNYDNWTVTYQGYANGVITYKIVNKQTNEVYYKYVDVAADKSTFAKEDGTACANPMLETSYLYIDGVRIFNPLAVKKDDGTIDYDPDGNYIPNESGAQILQIHDQVIAGNIAVGEVNSTSVSFGSGTSSYVENRNNNLITGNNSTSIDVYALVGPNNELYLNGLSLTQAIAFYVKPVDSVPLAERTLQIGVRGIDADAIEGYTSAKLIDDPNNDTVLLQSNFSTTGSAAWTKIAGINSGTEQYYHVDPTLCAYDASKEAYLVVLTAQNGMVSLTGLKVKGYELLQAYDSSSIVYNPDGSLTDSSIDVVNDMLDAFKATLQSREVVVPRAISSQPIDITLESPKTPEKTEAPYEDIKGTWYEEAVTRLNEKGLIYGFDDGLFHGERMMSRERFVVLLVRALNLKPLQDSVCRFADVKGRWSAKEVEIAAQYGLVAGVTETEFAPTRGLTRQEMMVIVARAIETLNIKTPEPQDLDRYTDTDQIAGWALDSVKLLVASGLISGVSATEIAPLRECSRSEMCMVIYRLICLSESK